MSNKLLPIEDWRKTDSGEYIAATDHTGTILNHRSRNKIIDKAVCELAPIVHRFESIVCCGTSGLMVVPQIAERLRKNIVVVRKGTDNCYSTFMIEGPQPRRFIIVDDLICSGNTIKHILSQISIEYNTNVCYPVGIYCYLPEHCFYGSSSIAYYDHPDAAAMNFHRKYKFHYLNSYGINKLLGLPAIKNV